MANANTNASTARTTKSRKGPKPIQTVAQLKENLLRDALAKEIKKIDRKLSVANRKRAAANARANDATRVIDDLNRIRAEFLRESNLAPKA
jgi:predicted flap endonuclease-1-like 5' DNA nuclease